MNSYGPPFENTLAPPEKLVLPLGRSLPLQSSASLASFLAISGVRG